ncbi:Na(+)/H(+) antiporter NhaA [Spirochaetota bacterium]|nr:Na(+)/H(+) antiporter NhaA [Spirochaetota bacterium]
MSQNNSTKKASIFDVFLEFSMPLILGVCVALVWANIDEQSYQYIKHHNFIEGVKLFNHELTLQFLVNDVFMVLFFAIAAVEITRAFQVGGPLHSVKSAINPLFGTIGGMVGPVAVFFALAFSLPLEGVLATEAVTMSAILNGWGIPTATDIALAWLATSLILGRKHPAIAFLLLLAIVDDALGLIIIAVFYPSPDYPVEPIYLLLNVGAIGIAYGLRKMRVHNIWAYIVCAGLPSWIGLLLAHLHPALAFVVVIPFMPDTIPEKMLKTSDKANNNNNNNTEGHRDLKQGFRGFVPSLTKFERTFEVPVDLGLFAFGLVNAGVGFASINVITWIIFLSLFLGKTIGIFGFSIVAQRLGYPLPDGINAKILLVIGMIAGMGLTVALFITAEAYPLPALQDPAKMGALFSAILGVFAYFLARFFRLKRIT